MQIKASLLLVLTVLFAAGAVQAQQQSRITGTVVEARSGAPLEGVTVVVVGTLFAAVTEAEGRFAIGPIPPGAYAVEVNALGFQTERRDVDIAAGVEEVLAFRLRVPEVEVERIEATALRRALQPVEGMQAGRLREINVQETGVLLRTLPGADAARRGGLDFEPVIRGLWGNQIGVYVDGARFLAGSPNGFGTPLSLFDPHTVASVEAVKGPYVLTWGAGTLSALRVTTRGAAAPGTRLRSLFQVGYTSKLNAVDAAGSLGGSSGKASYQLHGVYRTGGDYDDGSGQAVPAAFRAVAVRGQAAYRFRTSTRFVLQGGYQDRRDLDAPGALLTSGASEAADVSARFQTAWAVGPIRTFDVLASWHRRTQALEDPARMPGGRPVPLLAIDAEQTQLGGRLAAQLVPLKGWTLEVGADVYSILHDATRRLDVSSPFDSEQVTLRDARITDAGLFAGGTRVFGRVEATGTVRLDVVRAQAELGSGLLEESELTSGHHTFTETNVSGALALTAGLSSVWQVAVGVGSVTRTADAYERFALYAPFRRALHVMEVQGNPLLDPERSTQADLWLHASYPKLDLHLNTFVRRLSNFITIVRPPPQPRDPPDVPSPTRYVNNTATFYGAEMLAHYALLGEFATLNVGARYLWGHNDTQDEPAFGIAPASVVVGGRLAAPANLFFLEGDLRGAFEQTRVAATRGERSTGGYVTVNLRFGVSLPRSSSLILGIDNLGGRRYANHLNTRPLFATTPITEPGRVFYIRLRYGV